jgi:hypothetical protein
MTNMQSAEIMTATGGAVSRSGPETAGFGWLGLAATPSFALMALLTGVARDGGMDLLCSAAHGPWSIGGMAPMYLLMSVFHAAPWLKLVARLVPYASTSFQTTHMDSRPRDTGCPSCSNR